VGESGQAAGRHELPAIRFYSIKRFMGRKFDEVQEEIKRVPYKVVRAANATPRWKWKSTANPNNSGPPEISAMILGKLKSGCRDAVGREDHPGGHHDSGLFQ